MCQNVQQPPRVGANDKLELRGQWCSKDMPIGPYWFSDLPCRIRVSHGSHPNYTALLKSSRGQDPTKRIAAQNRLGKWKEIWLFNRVNIFKISSSNWKIKILTIIQAWRTSYSMYYYQSSGTQKWTLLFTFESLYVNGQPYSYRLSRFLQTPPYIHQPPSLGCPTIHSTDTCYFSGLTLKCQSRGTPPLYGAPIVKAGPDCCLLYSLTKQFRLW